MQAERIARLLPEVYQRTIVPGTPIATLLDVMSDLHAPVEDVLAHLPDYFDPQATPDRFVPFLARWVDLSRWLDESGGFDSGVGRLRQVVAGAAHLSRLRGTAQGLRDALEWATGVHGVRIEEAQAGGRPRPFHVVVTIPEAGLAHRPLIERIVQQEKPAHVTAEIVFEDGPAPAPDAAEPAGAPTLPVGAPDATLQPSFPGSEPAPVITGVPEPEAGEEVDAVAGVGAGARHPEPTTSTPTPVSGAPGAAAPAEPSRGPATPLSPTPAAPGPPTPAAPGPPTPAVPAPEEPPA